MPLEPGTHGIVSVEPLRVRDEHAEGDWSCSICGRMHPVASTWVLTFRPEDGPDLRFIVCPECGAARRPVGGVFDRQRLEEAPDLADVRAHIDRIAQARNLGEERYLPVRDADLHELAAARSTDLGRLIEDLEERGVLRRRQ